MNFADIAKNLQSEYIMTVFETGMGIAGGQRLRSAHRRHDLPRHQRTSLDRRAFSVAGSIVWIAPRRTDRRL